MLIALTEPGGTVMLRSWQPAGGATLDLIEKGKHSEQNQGFLAG